MNVKRKITIQSRREKFPVYHEVYATLKLTPQDVIMYSLLIRIKGELISQLNWPSFRK